MKKRASNRSTCTNAYQLGVWNKSPPSLIYSEEDKFTLTQPNRRYEMFTKSKIAFVAALILGTASAALAGSDNDDGAGHDRGEGRVQSWQDIQQAQGSFQSRMQAQYRTANAGSAYGLGSPTHKPASSHPKSRRDY
jgi:hypothetical protein